MTAHIQYEVKYQTFFRNEVWRKRILTSEYSDTPVSFIKDQRNRQINGNNYSPTDVFVDKIFSSGNLIMCKTKSLFNHMMCETFMKININFKFRSL